MDCWADRLTQADCEIANGGCGQLDAACEVAEAWLLLWLLVGSWKESVGSRTAGRHMCWGSGRRARVAHGPLSRRTAERQASGLLCLCAARWLGPRGERMIEQAGC